MSEPEELILEGAHFATRVARDLWRRHVGVAAGLPLADVRGRLELFVTALFGGPIAIGPLDPPAPVTWLAQFAHRSARTRDPAPLCGTDGERVFLPPFLSAVPTHDAAIARYRLFAVQQAARLSRQTPRVFEQIRNPRVRDWFMLAEAAVVDAWICVHVPGLVADVREARAEALTARSDRRSRHPDVLRLEREIQSLLAAPPDVLTVDLGAGASPQECLRWAETAVRPHAHGSRYDGVAPVAYWGTFVRQSTSQSTDLKAAEGQDRSSATRPPRVSEMRRRPQPRETAADEDDAHAGSWVIRADDPQESVEDPLGLQRPADRHQEADPEGLADSLSDLPEARVVRTRQQVHEVLRSGEAPRRCSISDIVIAAGSALVYPEWDYRTGQYRQDAAIVRQRIPHIGNAAWVAAVAARRGRLISKVRNRFERLRPRPVRVYGQNDGSEVDIAAYVTARADRQAGAATDGRLYVATRAERRELAVAVLVDVSASTDAWVSGNCRIIDVEKEAMLVVCEALDALGDRYGMFAFFSGEGPEDVSVASVKAFGERSTFQVKQQIAGLECDGYTRLGAAIRHVTAVLCRQTARARLLLLLSDGKPNDVDVYEGKYGVEDTRQAVAEARRQAVKVFCLTVDREAPRYAPRIFGAAGFSILHKAEQLPVVLVDVLRQLVRT